MISLSDDEGELDAIEDHPAAINNQSNPTILKSFSQLHAEETKNKEAFINDKCKNHEVFTCCLMFRCRRNVSSKSLGSTLGLLPNLDELSSSNDDGSSRAQGPGNGSGSGVRNLKKLVKRVLCNGTSEAGIGSSLGDHDLSYDGDHHGLYSWSGTPISVRNHQGHGDDIHVQNGNSYDEYMCSNNYLVSNGGHGDKRDGNHGGKTVGHVLNVDKNACMAQEVVHERVSTSRDTPVASSFVFAQSCFSSPSSTSSPSRCMKLESAHAWLIPAHDLDSCTTSPLHHNHLEGQPPAANHAFHVRQDDPRHRLANKRLNLSR